MISSSKKTVAVVVKIMKGTHDFRETSKSYIQCRNEVFIYEQFIPYLKHFIINHHSSIDCTQWTPKIYHSYYGKIPELSDMDECVLAMENLAVDGFKGGPRLRLDIDHLTLMVKKIAQYHSVQYAMRIENDPKLEAMRQGLTTLRWKIPGDPKDNVYEIIYGAGFERMFEYLDRHPELLNTPQMKEEVGILRQRYEKDPVTFLEMFREDDKAFSVIQHGDYNRNNVLFQYSAEDPEKPMALRMIDFQETRYGSPTADLFFFLYMSTTVEVRARHWDELLRLYYTGIRENLKDLLKCDDSDERLAQYSCANFEKHFRRFAFYGTMVTIHFLPWMDCKPEEVELLSEEFTHNMKSDKCHQMLLSVGGDASNQRVAEALQHACSRGYLSFIKNL